MLKISCKKSVDFFIIIHDFDNDLYFIKEICARIKVEPEIICEPNPLFIKGIIGKSLFTMSSRFHGLISALSQGVPVVATGWSHKYRMLLTDYNCLENVIEDLDQDVSTFIEPLMQMSNRESLIKRINDAARIQKDETLQMWDHVISLIDS